MTVVLSAPAPLRSWTLRAGGIAGLLIGVGYVAVIPIYVAVGVPPDGGAAWLDYGAGRTGAWWAILGLSVLTDFLFVPLAIALYETLKDSAREAMLLAVAAVGLFVVLDLSVTWTNYAALISLTDQYAAPTSEAERTALAGAAEYASAVTSSTLEAVYSIVTLSVGIAIVGWVMLRTDFGRATALLGIATGGLGIASVALSLVAGGLGFTIILASTLTTIWVLLVGYRLLRLRPTPDR